MTEYIIIVALIAIGAIATYSYFGQTVRGQTAQMAEQLSGTNTTGAGVGTAAAQGASGKADTQAGDAITTANFAQHGQ